MLLQPFYIDKIITTALEEDIHYVDVTTDYLLDDEHTSEAYYLAKDTGVLCGIDIAKRVFELAGGNVTMEILKKDGETVQKGDILARMKGSTKTLLKGERTALNLLQHMSGIATATAECVALVAGTRAQITDTRKTLPGLRQLQKYAVTVGGGKNHRYNLSDGAMLKDNHIDAYGSITGAVTALRKKIGHMVKIELEVRNLDELREALAAGADIIMLDNMSCDEMKKAVAINDGKVLLEASGNVTKDNIRSVAETGVDIISLGDSPTRSSALTFPCGFRLSRIKTGNCLQLSTDTKPPFPDLLFPETAVFVYWILFCMILILLFFRQLFLCRKPYCECNPVFRLAVDFDFHLVSICNTLCNRKPQSIATRCPCTRTVAAVESFKDFFFLVLSNPFSGIINFQH